MNSKIETVLSDIAEALNASHVLWAVGASLLLNRYNLAENPKDIDIVVSLRDIQTVDKVLSAMGKKQAESHSDIYATHYFYEYTINGVQVDVMAGFKININRSTFEYLFDEQSVPHRYPVGSTQVPYSTLEDWYVLYQLMPDREHKVSLIAEYFGRQGVQYPQLLQRMSKSPNLPLQVKNDIEKFIF